MDLCTTLKSLHSKFGLFTLLKRILIAVGLRQSTEEEEREVERIKQPDVPQYEKDLHLAPWTDGMLDR